MTAKRSKGINARAWFYSQSFSSSALGLDPVIEEAREKRMAELKAELAKLQDGEGARMSLEGALIDAEQYRSDSSKGEL